MTLTHRRVYTTSGLQQSTCFFKSFDRFRYWLSPARTHGGGSSLAYNEGSWSPTHSRGSVWSRSVGSHPMWPLLSMLGGRVQCQAVIFSFISIQTILYNAWRGWYDLICMQTRIVQWLMFQSSQDHGYFQLIQSDWQFGLDHLWYHHTRNVCT